MLIKFKLENNVKFKKKMNPDLIENAVKYHGAELFVKILEQNNCLTFDHTTDNNLTSIESNIINDKKLSKNIQNFIAKKSDYLFSEKYFGHASKKDEKDLAEIKCDGNITSLSN